MRVWSPIFGSSSFYFSQRVGQTTTEECFILLGTVDQITRPITSPALYRNALEVLTFTWIGDGCNRAWVMFPPSVRAFLDPAINARLHALHREWREFCNDRMNQLLGVRCGPDLYRLLDPALHLLPFPDGVHLNAPGNDIVADEIKRLLKL